MGGRLLPFHPAHSICVNNREHTLSTAKDTVEEGSAFRAVQAQRWAFPR
jgi:hypothetical protein